MIYMLTEVVNFRSGNFRNSKYCLVTDSKQCFHGSWIRKFPPCSFRNYPLLALRRLMRLALAERKWRLTAMIWLV